jgi:pectinesterase
MDVYLPDTNESSPAIIYIHGGGWAKGSRTDFNTTAAFYAKRGIAGFSIDYTLTPPNGTAWPQNIQDVVAAVSFIRENSKSYRIDTQKIAVLGDSAGAQLASLVGTLSGNESFLADNSVNEKIRSQICLVIDYSGVTDLEFVGEHENPSFIYNIVTSSFGNVTYSQNPKLWIEASPATYIAADDPVFVFIHGTNDIIVPIQDAKSFDAKLRAAGVETHFIEIAADHNLLTNEAWNLQARYMLEPLLKRFFGLNQTATQ